MRHIITILRWEISKVLSSWQKTLAIFLIPAAVMVGAISLFPKLLNYLSTGSAGNQKVIVVDAPKSFIDYDGKKDDLYNYVYSTMDEIEDEPGSGDEYELVKNGDIILVFHTKSGMDFDESVIKRYEYMIADITDDPGEDAVVTVLYNNEQFTMATKGMQFYSDVVATYQAYMKDFAISQFEGYQYTSLKVDEFNPITSILDHRASANTQAARVIPGIMMILIYYCVYSLTLDMIAMEKNRGFLNKLIMTPVSARTLLAGKAMAINILVTGSSLVTFFLLFLSSWLNRSNEAGSLLPFGLLLMPDQLLYLVICVPFCVFVLTGFCFLVAINLEKVEDTTANLQMVLLLLVIGFFIGMFVYWSPIAMEYVIPVHNTIALIRSILLSEVSLTATIVVIVENSVIGLLLLRRCAGKLSGGLK